MALTDTQVRNEKPGEKPRSWLMALTFVRTTELIAARWEEFDLKAARWHVPAASQRGCGCNDCFGYCAVVVTVYVW